MYKLISTMKFRPKLSSTVITAILLLCVATGGCSQPSDAPAWPVTDIDWPLDHTGTRRVKLHVLPGYNAGVRGDYLEKKIYPQGRPKDPNNVREVLLLETLWPEMGPRLWRNNEEFRVPGGGRVLDIFVESGAVDPKKHAQDKLHIALNVDVSNLRRVCIRPRRVVDGAKCHDLDKLAEKPAKFGLKRVGVDFNKLPDLPKDQYNSYNDIYYTPEIGDSLVTQVRCTASGGYHRCRLLGNSPRTYISCTAEEVEPLVNGLKYIPHCKQYFIFKPLNARVSVNYRRIYLEDWQAVQAAVEKLLQSFIVQQ